MTSDRQNVSDDLLTATDVAALLRINRRQLRVLVRNGLPVVRLPGVGPRFALADVSGWVDAKRRSAA